MQGEIVHSDAHQTYHMRAYPNCANSYYPLCPVTQFKSLAKQYFFNSLLGQSDTTPWER